MSYASFKERWENARPSVKDAIYDNLSDHYDLLVISEGTRDDAYAGRNNKVWREQYNALALLWNCSSLSLRYAYLHGLIDTGSEEPSN